jgi:hypothetical protein
LRQRCMALSRRAMTSKEGRAAWSCAQHSFMSRTYVNRPEAQQESRQRRGMQGYKEMAQVGF